MFDRVKNASKKGAKKAAAVLAYGAVITIKYLNISLRHLIQNAVFAKETLGYSAAVIVDSILDPINNGYTRVVDAIYNKVKSSFNSERADRLLYIFSTLAYIGLFVVIHLSAGALGSLLITNLAPVTQFTLARIYIISVTASMKVSTILHTIESLKKVSYRFKQGVIDDPDNDPDNHPEQHRGDLTQRRYKSWTLFGVVINIIFFIPILFINILQVGTSELAKYSAAKYDEYFNEYEPQLGLGQLPQAIFANEPGLQHDPEGQFQADLGIQHEDVQELDIYDVVTLYKAKWRVLEFMFSVYFNGDIFLRLEEARRIEQLAKKIAEAENKLHNSLFLVKIYNWCADKINALYPNHFDRAVDRAIQTQDFSHVTTYLQSNDKYNNFEMFKLGAYWSRRQIWEIKNSKYSPDRYWQDLGIDNDKLLELAQANDSLCCQCITLNLMALPSFLEKSNGSRTHLDLQPLLINIIEGNASNPETNEPIENLNALHISWAKYAQKQNLLAAELAKPEMQMPVQTFDQVLQAVLDSGDFKALADYLTENGSYVINEEREVNFWKWDDIEDQLANSKFKHKLPKETEEQLESTFAEDAKEKCLISRMPAFVPVYLSSEIVATRKYCDLFQLLGWLQRNDTHPTLGITVKLHDICIDMEMYKKLADMRSNPDSYLEAARLRLAQEEEQAKLEKRNKFLQSFALRQGDAQQDPGEQNNTSGASTRATLAQVDEEIHHAAVRENMHQGGIMSRAWKAFHFG